MLLDKHIIHHVCRDHSFKNEKLFYRFDSDEPNKGQPRPAPPNLPSTWSEYFSENSQSSIMASDVPEGFTDFFEKNPYSEEVFLDFQNAKTLDNARPARWEDPKPAQKYHMVAIGAGAGGLVTAGGAASLGGKAAIIERGFMGGDCLNTGCVPSKALLKCAGVYQQIKNASEFGVIIGGEVSLDFSKVMERMRRIRAEISEHDSCKRFTDEFGVDVYLGHARFASRSSLVVNGETIEFEKCCIATGGKPKVAQIPGIDKVPFYTSENIWNLTKLPKRLVFIGAGPIGCELAQAFARFGSRVTMVSNQDQFLPREDRDAALILEEQLVAEGVCFRKNASVERVDLLSPESEDGFPLIQVVVDGERHECEAVMMAVGRTPNVEGLDLETAGVEYTQSGITVNDYLKTSNKNIYAVGDCASKYQFTHVADAMARIVLRNALFHGKSKFSELCIPWCTYTEPEIAHVGCYSRELKNQNYQEFVKYFKEVDRAITEGETQGFVKILCKGKSDEILGATIVGKNAGDMISEISVALVNKVGLGKIAKVIHPYPTLAEAIKMCADDYNRTRLTPTAKSFMRFIINST